MRGARPGGGSPASARNVSDALGPGPHPGLVRALGSLVAGERLRRVDVAERGMGGDEPPPAAFTPNCFASTEPSALTFISPKPGSAWMFARSSLALRGVCPDARRVAAVALADMRGQFPDPLCHFPGEAVPAASRGRQAPAPRMRDGRHRACRSVREVRQRAHEGLLHGDLLIQRKPDQAAPADRRRSADWPRRSP